MPKKPRPPAGDNEPAAQGAGTEGNKAVEQSPARVEAGTAAWPLPSEFPQETLEGADLIVTAKSDKGFRRAGYGFTREETIIALADLDEAKLAAITGEKELVCAVRFYRPA